ncbi:MAG: HAMP domain-containing histidine kinase [Candidatus Bathyarchaeota archaeon]|nr:MAG: HAMP domain-containing histidine kinase [Candidatus Bathyarchaeota archaeon]
MVYCKRVVESHSGSTAAESTEEVGTTFTLSLLLKEF